MKPLVLPLLLEYQQIRHSPIVAVAHVITSDNDEIWRARGFIGGDYRTLDYSIDTFKNLVEFAKYIHIKHMKVKDVDDYYKIKEPKIDREQVFIDAIDEIVGLRKKR
jgi:hypothetical protein